MRYGIPYQGSKNSIAREIVRFLPATGTLIDICAGGGGALRTERIYTQRGAIA